MTWALIEVVYAFLFSIFPSRKTGDILLNCEVGDLLWFLGVVWVWQEYFCLKNRLTFSVALIEGKNEEERKVWRKKKAR